MAGLRDEPCAFKRQCFRDGWDAAIAALPNKAGSHPMSDMRETLMGIIARDVMDAGETADAIIEALPDMVEPLKWEKLSENTYRCKSHVGYNVRVETYGGACWSINWSAPGITDTLIEGKFTDAESAMGAYNKHRIAAILSAFGVQGGEA